MGLADMVPCELPEKPVEDRAPPPYKPEHTISRLASIIAHDSHFSGNVCGLDNSERAALARLDPNGELRPHQLAALSRAMIHAGIEPETWKPEAWRRWALIAYGMALAGHDATEDLGQQISKADISEFRLTKLLTSRGDAFRELLPRVLRLLAKKNVAANWHDLGGLILSQECDEEKAEGIRLKIAGRFFVAEAKKLKR